MELLLLSLILILALALALALFFLSRKPKVNTELEHFMQQQNQQLQQTTQLLLQQLGQQQAAQDRSAHMVHTRIDHATKVVSEVQGKLLQLEEANKRIFELGKDISNLQQILQAPKLRGGMGEIWLEDLIGQIIPAGHFTMQYRFKSGEICDAVILLRDGLMLPIDSKFSLENFVKMLEAPEEGRAVFRKQFASDTKKRIDEIAKKYILPGEGTLEFACMYVPAENVYYQAFIQDHDLNLLQYAFDRRVIPVSPSSFYAYLQVILFGLRGLEIEKSAKAIQKNLTGLHLEFGKFRETYEKVGLHLGRAQASFDQTDKRLDKVSQKFQLITQTEAPVLEVAEEETIIIENE